MIGPSHLPEPSRSRPPRTRPARVAVVTGSRAEFGLLTPVMLAIHANAELELAAIAAGSHLIQPAETFRDVKKLFNIADSVPMQVAGRTGRYEDAEAVGKGVGRFARSFQRLNPDWVVLLGDRIEPFAAASAAALMGIAIAHVHGGDRAEGVADESMRHAITKLAHLHLPATKQSAERIVRMGEKPEYVHAIGSPAIDTLASITPLDDAAYADLGSPKFVFLMHPVGRHAEMEEAAATNVTNALRGEKVLALHPNPSAIREISHIATLPEITLKIVELVEDPKSTAQDLHKVISNDPALCSRILKVVNSSFYGLPGQIGSINRAIVMLGLNAVKNIAIAASLAKLFRGGELTPASRPSDLWTHSNVAPRRPAR
jgi:UDP-N-acetylglucosamine 2-epimerase